MPGPLRVEFSGANYHLMNRGDCREPIPGLTTGTDRAAMAFEGLKPAQG